MPALWGTYSLPYLPFLPLHLAQFTLQGPAQNQGRIKSQHLPRISDPGGTSIMMEARMKLTLPLHFDIHKIQQQLLGSLLTHSIPCVLCALLSFLCILSHLIAHIQPCKMRQSVCKHLAQGDPVGRWQSQDSEQEVWLHCPCSTVYHSITTVHTASSFSTASGT